MPLMLHATMTPVNVGTIASGMWRRYVATAAFSSFLRWSPAIVSTMPPQIVTVAGLCIRQMNMQASAVLRLGTHISPLNALCATTHRRRRSS